MPPESAIVQRTLEMLVLKALSLAPMHGWGIGQRIDQLSKGTFQVQQGSLYPALNRMEADGLVVRVPHAGYRIPPQITRERFEDMLEIRLLLEPAAARKAGATAR